MTYDLNLRFNNSLNYIVIDDDNPEGLTALKHILNLPEKTTEIRIYGFEGKYFVEE